MLGSFSFQKSNDQPSYLSAIKTCESVATYYYWPTIYRDVANYVKTCEICQQCKVPQLAPAGLMAKRVINRPWASVSSDAMGHYQRTTKGNNYLLVFTDSFTKWVELVPVRVINGKILTREIKETIFLRYGVCDEFISDNSSEFDNKDVTKLLDEYGSSHTLIPP